MQTQTVTHGENKTDRKKTGRQPASMESVHILYNKKWIETLMDLCGDFCPLHFLQKIKKNIEQRERL